MGVVNIGIKAERRRTVSRDRFQRQHTFVVAVGDQLAPGRSPVRVAIHDARVFGLVNVVEVVEQHFLADQHRIGPCHITRSQNLPIAAVAVHNGRKAADIKIGDLHGTVVGGEREIRRTDLPLCGAGNSTELDAHIVTIRNLCAIRQRIHTVSRRLHACNRREDRAGVGIRENVEAVERAVVGKVEKYTIKINGHCRICRPHIYEQCACISFRNCDNRLRVTAECDGNGV